MKRNLEPSIKTKNSWSSVSSFQSRRNFFILLARIHFEIFRLEVSFFKIEWTSVNSSMFIITRSEIWLLLWRVSFLLKQNVFTVVIWAEVLPPIWLSLIKWGTLSKRSLSGSLLTFAVASIDYFFAFKLSVRWSLKSFSKETWSCFYMNVAFSISIDATCDEVVHVMLSNTFFLLI